MLYALGGEAGAWTVHSETTPHASTPPSLSTWGPGVKADEEALWRVALWPGKPTHLHVDSCHSLWEIAPPPCFLPGPEGGLSLGPRSHPCHLCLPPLLWPQQTVHVGLKGKDPTSCGSGNRGLLGKVMLLPVAFSMRPFLPSIFKDTCLPLPLYMKPIRMELEKT